MDARLKVLSGPSDGETIPFVRSLIVGREENCHLRPASQFISRHAEAVLVRRRSDLLRFPSICSGDM